MAEGKKSFIAYSDWYGTFKALPDDVAGQLIKYIFSYVNDEDPEPHENFMVNALFQQFKATLKRDLDKWTKQREQRSKAGKRSAELRATKSNECSTVVNENVRNPTVSVSVSVSDNVNNINNIYNKFVDEVKNHKFDSRVESMYMRLKLKQGSLTPLLIDFKNHIIEKNRVHKNTEDFFDNFGNWLNTQDIIGKLKEYKN